MKKLLLVAHSPSENTQALQQALCQGVISQALEQVEFKSKTPFETQAEDVLSADAIILGTTENLGYMSGALKDFFSLYTFNLSFL
ncbi:hypothetical protein A3735_07750 [Oleiphilus sp. HI0061]|uniref:hypothetical protein n=1 Tax=Oleiphilus sp. HI0061 TaxID=1822239 RepID=UPI0007CF7222|nr:hypothetical protein [Oleiphilus sp. HI0061]KZY55865.1 hypothetical protein A3735_20310 [Oleiphilus sp. HI0061]KZY65716.1 hypothetical protein A3735_07750 [Oleiphilus sp. HI0061]